MALIKAINAKYQFTSEIFWEAGRIITTNKNETPTAIDALAIIKHLNDKYEIKQTKELFYWDMSSDACKDYVTKTELNFKVIAKDINGNEIQDITWNVSEGRLDTNKGTVVNWTIPSVEETYTITAKKDDENILQKEIRYIDINSVIDSIELDTEQIEIEKDGDEDSDGLTNEEEYELGTEIFCTDSDGDGLSDYEEIKTYNTNPLKEDTDDDGIKDINEILLGLNPLSKDSNNDGILDSDEIVEYTAENSELGIRIAMKGNANISDTQIDTVEINELDNIEAKISSIYSFNTSGELETANVEIAYDETVITEKGIDEKNISLYYFNPIDYTFEKVETQIDTENNIAKATLEHFSMYLLADKTKMVNSLSNQIMFVIDNSASMYTAEQIAKKNLNTDANDESFEDVVGNDPEYKRLEFVSELINKLDANFEYGISKFTADYTEVCKMGSNNEKIKRALADIKKNGENFNGTYIGASIYMAALCFPTKSAFNRYIVLISDGEDTAPSKGIIRDWAIATAKEKNIKIITIGIGKDIDQADLRKYAEKTGGKYYHVDNANALEDIYTSLYGELNLKRDTITNENGEEEDYLVVADSGFIPEVNGFAFKNYRTCRAADGQCYGMAQFAKLFYTDSLNSTGNMTRKFEENTINFNYDLSNLQELQNCINLSNYKFANEAFEKIMLLSSAEEGWKFEKFEEEFNNGTEKPYLELKDDYKQYVKETEGLIKIRTSSDESRSLW